MSSNTINIEIDFTEDIRFKLLCLHTINNIKGISYNPIPVVRDIINTFGSILNPVMQITEEEMIPQLLPYKTIKKIRTLQQSKKSIKEITDKTQKILSDYRVYTKDIKDKENKIINSITLEMQKRVGPELVIRIGKGLMLGNNEIAYNSADYSKTGKANAIWFTPTKQIPQFADNLIVEVLTVARPQDDKLNSLDLYELGHSVIINLKSKKLRDDKLYKENVRLQKWLDFLLKGVLDLNDPIFQEVYNLCKYLKSDREADTMATSYMSYSDELEYYARREAKEEGRVEGKEEGIGIGIDIGKEEGIVIGIDIGVEKGRVEGKEEKALEIAIDLLDVLDDKTIALKTGFSEDEIKKLRIEHGK